MKKWVHLRIIHYVLRFTFYVLLCVPVCAAQTWEDEVESDLIRGRIYRSGWETAVTAEAELCAQIAQHFKVAPQKLAYYHGIYAFQQGDFQEAQAQFRAFLSTKPKADETSLFFDLAELWLGACAYKLDGKALPKIPPKSVEETNRLRWKSELGYLLAWLDINPSEGYEICQESFTQAESQNVDDLDIFRVHLGYTALRQGDLAQADKLFKAIDHRRPEYVDVYNEVKFFDGVVEPLDLKFYHPAILDHRAEYHFRKAAAQGREEAEKGNLKGKYWLGVCGREIGGAHLEEALQLLAEVANAQGDAKLAMLASIQLGACLYLKGEKEQANEKWAQVNPASDAQIANELAETYMALQIEPETAANLYRSSRKQLRELPEYQSRRQRRRKAWRRTDAYKQYTWNLAFALFKADQPSAAENELKKVYLPHEKKLLDSPNKKSPHWQILSLRRHLNLAQLARCYLDYTRYNEMYFYIYWENMLPKSDYYPETYQLFPCLKWLDLLKKYKPKVGG